MTPEIHQILSVSPSPYPWLWFKDYTSSVIFSLVDRNEHSQGFKLPRTEEALAIIIVDLDEASVQQRYR
jgi:hypothetical protein